MTLQQAAKFHRFQQLQLRHARCGSRRGIADASANVVSGGDDPAVFHRHHETSVVVSRLYGRDAVGNAPEPAGEALNVTVNGPGGEGGGPVPTPCEKCRNSPKSQDLVRPVKPAAAADIVGQRRFRWQHYGRLRGTFAPAPS